MVQFYCICLDAYPNTKLLQEKLSHLTPIQFVCAGAFTTATMTSMISGTVGSKIIPGGIGANTSYTSGFNKWRKEGSALMDVLQKNGLDVVIHNHVPWMSTNIAGVELTPAQKSQHYRDHQISDSGIHINDFGVILKKEHLIFSSTHPDFTLNTFIEWGDQNRKNTFYHNENLYFNYIKNNFQGLLWTDLCHWHEAVYYPDGNPYHKGSNLLPIKREDALNDSISWLDNFDWDQPETVYFIYADHSHRVEPYLDPPGFITWAYFKDNRSNKYYPPPTMSSYDIYSLILNTFNLSDMSADLNNPLNRIYYTEDGRANATIKDIATTFVTTRQILDSWFIISKVIPGGACNPGYYVMIAPLKNHHTYDLFYYDNKEWTWKQIIAKDGLSERKTITKGTNLIQIPFESPYKELWLNNN